MDSKYRKMVKRLEMGQEDFGAVPPVVCPAGRKTGSAFWLFLLFVVFIPVPAAMCQEPQVRVVMPVSDAEQAFRDELGLVARRAVALGHGRFSAVRLINDSYQLTAQAVMILVGDGDLEEVIPLLQRAIEKYKRNRLAYLLLGYAFERSGNQDEAAHTYADFYRNSLTLAPMENRLIGRSSLEVFRNYVEMRFQEWGHRLPEAKLSLRIHGARFLVALEESRAGQILNFLLPLVVIGGLVAFILIRLTEVELPKAASYFLVRLYLLSCFAYFVWGVHFFMGLPFLGSLEIEFLLLFGTAVALMTISYAFRRWSVYRKEEGIEGTKRCRHCRKQVLLVAVECPHCKESC